MTGSLTIDRTNRTTKSDDLYEYMVQIPFAIVKAYNDMLSI
jgi:hypothetical protein